MWEDTVLSDEEIEWKYRLSYGGSRPSIQLDTRHAREIVKDQAKATWEACEKATRQGIVEWIKTHAWQGDKLAPGFDPPKGYLIRDEDLKELVIE